MEKKPIVNYSGTLKELQTGDTRIATGIPASNKTAGFTVVAADIGKTFLCSGTFTVAFDAASTLTSSFYCTIINTGAGAITLDPNGTELINGVATFVLAVGESCQVFCSGTALWTWGVVYVPPATPPPLSGVQKALFGYGYTTVNVSMTNLVSNTGVVATDTTGVGTSRQDLAAAGYGGDKAVFGYGMTGKSVYVSMTNLVSNIGVVATDTTGVGTARRYLAAAGYGLDKAIFGYGSTGSNVSMTNLVSNTGVVATDTTGVGTARYSPAAAGYSLT